ncbi:hypothetical protein Tco_0107933 [Tanacetum coccineum]
MRAVFSPSLKSLAIMTGNLLLSAKNTYSRWGGKSLSSTSGGSSIEDSADLQTLSSFLISRGWMSSVLGSSISFVTSLSFSTTGGGIGGPSYEAPLRVVMALASFLAFGMVLLGNELELKAWLV